VTSPPEDRSVLILADRIHTLAQTGTDAGADAILVRNGVIAAIGSRDRIGSAGVEATIDLSGSTLTPGLIDSHIHLTEWALARRDTDLAATESPEAAARAVYDAGPSAHGEWIRGRGWNPHRWSGRQPARAIIDALFPDRPVLLQSHDMHALWVNGAALRRAGIEAGTADPHGGRIVRDERGEPTGLLLETAAQLITRSLPPVSVHEAADAVAAGQAVLHGWGITGVHTLPAIHIAEPEPLSVLEAMRSESRLRLRVLQHLPLYQLDDAIRIGLYSGFGGDWIRVGGVKMFLDGALGSRTALMFEPYEGSEARGIQVLDAGEFRYQVRRAAKAGLASTVHAIGDAAVGLAIDVLGDGANRVQDMPHRIEHVQCLPRGRVADIGRAGISASMQPGHLITDWRIADRHWGPDRASRTFALRSLLDGGALLAFGSDAPVEPADPRLGLFAAVARTDLEGRPVNGWFADERLSIEQTFAGYTTGPARAAASRFAGLVPGAHADIAAWRTDPFVARPDELLTLDCVATIVAGEIARS
jgi:predicted amidohydrolase YtcJ